MKELFIKLEEEARRSIPQWEVEEWKARFGKKKTRKMIKKRKMEYISKEEAPN